MNIHFIAIGGSIMHNLAIELKNRGNRVTGSDDVIFDPGKSKLGKNGLLPEKQGWFPEKIHSDIDAIILGMHAKKDNPELIRATELGIPVFSFPEFIYNQTADMKRIAICGSHGKTTITSMIMHVLRLNNIEFNYLVGAELDGFENMVKVDPAVNMIIIEGDEYLASALRPVSKFLFYNPNITVLSGIAWDHINVFPTFDGYVNTFRELLKTLKPEDLLIYNDEDKLVGDLVKEFKNRFLQIGYCMPTYALTDNRITVNFNKNEFPLEIFGRHNLSNMEAARQVCKMFNIDANNFYNAMQSFKGAAKRLQLIKENKHTQVYLDFAHSPSKVQASVQATKEKYPNRELTACLELHTYSSLNKDFLKEYRNTLNEADTRIIFIDDHAMKIKNVALSAQDIKSLIGDDKIQVFTSTKKLEAAIRETTWKNKTLLMMSSGNFGKININDLATFVAA
jgi:UDP-N-acetylmuramate: L-alanyl-gamma-D-glutamyl-meso-diaminopimelate ligase